MKKISKMITVSVVIVSFVFIGSSADAWWIFGSKKKEAPAMTTPTKEVQVKPLPPTFTPVPPTYKPKFPQPTPAQPTDPCSTPPRIEVMPPSDLKTAREGLNRNMFDSQFYAFFKVVGGRPPYTWGIKSSYETNVLEIRVEGDIYPEHMWAITPTGTDEAAVRGRFFKSLTYCKTVPEMLDRGDIRDPITGFLINPAGCDDYARYNGEAWTVSVTDSCPNRHMVEENYAFELDSPPEKVSDLSAAIRLCPINIGIPWSPGIKTDFDNEICGTHEDGQASCVQFRFFDARNNVVAHSDMIDFKAELEGTCREFRLAVHPEEGMNLNLEDITKLTLRISDMNFGELRFAVGIDKVKVFSKYRYYYFGPGALGYGGPIRWQVPYEPPLSTYRRWKEETIGVPPIKWRESNEPYRGPTGSAMIGY